MSGPLTGLKVVELQGIGPAPLAATLLADLGADVLRISRPEPELAHGWDGFGRGRPYLRMDLKQPADKARFLEIVGKADVLLEGYRPGVAERLGIGPCDLPETLIYARMTGWGQDGPRALQAGHDINYISLTGGLHAIGEHGGPPVVPLNLVGDFGGGTAFVVIGILAALQERAQSGKGQVVDCAMVDGAAYLMSMLHREHNRGIWKDERGANLLDGGASYYGVYETSDGLHMAVGPIEEPFYVEMLAKLELADVPARTRENWGELKQILTQRFKEKTRAEWEQIFDGSDACVSPVLSLKEAPLDPHMAARGTFLPGPSGGWEPGPAPRFSRTPGSRVERDDADVLLKDWGL